MGTDIHASLEIKDTEGWHTWCEPAIARSYSLFELMAGVRGQSHIVVEPKGLPEQPAINGEYVGMEFFYPFHTPSWLTRDEVGDIASAYLEFYEGPNRDIEVILAIMKAFDYLGTESRLVFYFDN